MLTKNRTQMTKPDPPFSLLHIKPFIFCTTRCKSASLRIKKALGKNQSSSLKISAKLLGSLSRAVSVTWFRLAAGLDFLQAYLYRMRIADSHFCLLCDHNVPLIRDYLNIYS
ncbi:hypothetical protein TNCV_2616031 [Trichonephila clavipes]|nr:hypothetical protein TNCV_2616031 [Trichonephila clavipes]